MSETQRWAIVTSDHVRHRYFANALSAHPLVEALVVEPKSRNPANNHNNSADALLLAAYFDRRDISERTVLSAGEAWNFARPLRKIDAPKGGINDPDIVAELVAAGIDHCIVFGSSWLKGPWLEAFPGRLFNLHLGLSPYYRGVGTNFWPLHDGLPEYVGATIHLLDEGIDSGPILFQVRPNPSPDDDPHSLGNKTIAKATKALADRLHLLPTMPRAPQMSGENERNFRSKDFDANALRHLIGQLDGGMMAEYVRDLQRRALSVPLVAEYEPLA
ncbi:formyltransferase family protein [Rhizobium sp. AG855]|uniref:formyltransferase family protein n=1 Tax=Rhizobium sp. AG855 TaxID=2183898 RepID=UPI000E70E70D|nr:formyltransferase family protein [Rhizobium sp. AG855]RKE85551.1 formyl transferase-like protein [Rhizobium sp. AG855]